MPFSGTGIFTRVYQWVVDAANSVPVDATRTDTDSNDIAAGLSNCVTRDGQSPWLANLPAGGYKITGLGNGALASDSVNYGQVFSSPAFTTPTATTSPAVGDSSLLLATTAFVAAQIASATLPGQLNNQGKELETDGSVASWGYFSQRDARTANAILVQADNRKFIDITSGTFTQTVTAAATLGNGWSVRIRNSGSGTITLPLADAVTSKLIPGATADLLCNGTTFNLVPVNDNRPRVTVVLTTVAANSWSPPYDCTATVTVTGGGGSGGYKDGGAFDGALAGAAAGTAIKFNLALSAAVTYTATVGAGGTAPGAPGTGASGGNSSFSGSGITTLTANGGAGGARISSGAAISDNNAAAGGTATGGDLNLRGGDGLADVVAPAGTIGSTISTAHSWGVYARPGGVSYWGPGGPIGTAAANYGAGGAGSGANASTPASGKQGVIIIEYE